MARIDINAAFESKPEPLDFVLPGLLVGTVGALFSPGSTGKSFLLLEAAMGISCAVAGGDLLNIRPERTGRVVYIAAEDPVEVLTHRIHAMGTHLSDQARRAIAEALDLQCVVGKRMNIMLDQQLEWLLQHAMGARLILIDTLSRVHQLDENSAGDMGQLLGVLEYISTKTGAALIFAHHVSKGAARDGQGDQQHAARGSSVLTDNARWGAALARMSASEASGYSDDPESRRPIGDLEKNWFVRMSIPKANYSEPLTDRWFRRGNGGVLTPVELMKIESHQRAGGVTPLRGRKDHGYQKTLPRSAALGEGGSRDWE